MDEKKIRKAVQMLRIEKKECKKLLDFHGNKQWNSGILRRKIKDCNTAIEALEKQLPKKVKQSGVTTQDGMFHRINGIDGVPYDLCPNCEVNLCTDGILGRSKKDMKYCERCGQRLDWSE